MGEIFCADPGAIRTPGDGSSNHPPGTGRRADVTDRQRLGRRVTVSLISRDDHTAGSRPRA